MTKRQLNLIINGTPYEVEVGDLGAELIQVSVNGKPYEVKLAQSVSGPAEVPTRESAAPAARPATVQAATSKPVERAQIGARNEVRSPMPGTILNIAVKVGEKVSRGQQLCALEAMKMKSAIRSARDGVITCVEVSDGQKVAYNDLLFKFE